MAANAAPQFPPDYRAAREAFRQAASAARCQLSGHALSARAGDGGELTVDVAYHGPDEPAGVLAVSSGIHGVEGFAGSAIQHDFLTRSFDAARFPKQLGLLLVHAVNPYGFSQLRRVNESNVDLNRNFVTHPEGHQENPGYEELHDVINPPDLDPETEATCNARIRAYTQQHGRARMQEALTRGQYRFAEGVQFGGTRVEESASAFEALAAEQTRGAHNILWLDLHTGLGNEGALELISEYPADDPAFLRSRAWFGERARSTLAGDSVSVPLCGVIEEGLERALPDRALTPLTAEFGTYDSGRVFWAMRADNWLHHHGEIESAQGHAIQQELVEVFCPASPSWRREIVSQGTALLRTAASALAAE
jgi:hypothetical protein